MKFKYIVFIVFAAIMGCKSSHNKKGYDGIDAEPIEIWVNIYNSFNFDSI